MLRFTAASRLRRHAPAVLLPTLGWLAKIPYYLISAEGFNETHYRGQGSTVNYRPQTNHHKATMSANNKHSKSYARIFGPPDAWPSQPSIKPPAERHHRSLKDISV
ncbi:hypothetical protein MTO96_027921 [Rhipicephalus appendiculatus]